MTGTLVRRLTTARDYARRFGVRETARYATVRLWGDVEHLTRPARIRLAGPAGAAPHLPGVDPRWARDAVTSMRLTASVPDGVLGPDEEWRAVRWLERRSAGQPLRDDVTVVIPAYQQTAWLLACVRSLVLAAHPALPRVVVVDDASPAADLALVERLPFVTFLRNDANAGYVATVNRGADEVRTPLMVTLNQDVLVAPGWLDALVDALLADPGTGIAGPRVLDGHLRIAEAGGLVFRDGSAANRGRGRRADDPSVACARDVDYVSGCCLAIRTDTWAALGGLSEAFAPAYYDDVDLCLRAQEAGLRVRYVPGSVVLHAEGTSMGRDVTDASSTKHHQVRHRDVLAARHPAALAARPERPIDPASAEPAAVRPRCLLALGSAPERQRDGGSVEAWALITHLQRLGWDVTAVLDEPATADARAHLQLAGVEVLAVDERALARRLVDSALLVSYGFAGGRTAAGVRAAADAPDVPPHLHLTCDVAARRLASFLDAGLERDPAVARWYPGVPATVEGTWQAERRLLDAADLCVFVTDEDLAFARGLGYDGAATVSPVMRDQSVAPRRQPPADPVVGFVGSMRHGPNVDAVRWFLAECWPRVRAAVPDARFEVHGSGQSSALQREIDAVPGARAMGAYAAGADVYGRMRVAVAPVRLGAGLNTKVLDAMLHATPVVGTSLAFEGLGSGSGIVADDPAALVDAVAALLVDDAAWSAQAEAGRSVAERDHTPSAEQDRLERALAVVQAGVTS